MTKLAPVLQAFFSERLIGQRQASPNTVASYRDAFRLLLAYVRDTTGKCPDQLDLENLDAARIGSFLAYLERDRGVSAATRNTRLAAVHSFFNYAAFQHPENSALISQVLAIPPKRYDRLIVTFLSQAEMDALIAAPDLHCSVGRRDHALICLALQTGLRASELTQLRRKDLGLARGAHVRVKGKGRKERVTPLNRQTAMIMTAWLDELGGQEDDPVFPGPSGGPIGRDAVRKLVVRQAKAAGAECRTLATKQIGAHTLRHSCAMNMLRSGIDIATIALWLGHEDLRTVQRYLHADVELKERALARVAPPNTVPGRYMPPDHLLAFLEAL